MHLVHMGSSDLLCNMKTYILTMASYTVKTCEDIHKGKTAGNATFTDLKSDYMVILYKFCYLTYGLGKRLDP